MEKSTILLFGGTGFIGKVVLERILAKNKCTFIYLVIRSKRGSTPEERFKQLCERPCFQRVRGEFEKGRVKIIPGDTTLSNLGMSSNDRQLICTRVTHILSLAACVDFDLPLATAATSNITSALGILALAKECMRLKSFVHCSTAYVMSPRQGAGPISEVHVPTFADGRANQLYDRIMGGVTLEEERKLLQDSGFPNTYTYTKALAEALLVGRRDNVPLVIVRPSIVTACLRDPLPGWIDSKATLAAFIALYAAGFLHTVPADLDVKLDIVPCDYVAERLLCAAFEENNKDGDTRIIHATAGLEHAASVEDIRDHSVDYFKPKHRHVRQKPFLRVMANNSDPRVAKSFAKDKRYIKRMMIITRLLGQKETSISLGKILVGLDKTQKVFSFFSHHTFDFRSRQSIKDVMPFLRRRSSCKQ